MRRFIELLSDLPREAKNLIQIGFDIVLLLVAYLLTISLVVESTGDQDLLLGTFFVFFSAIGLWLFGAYKAILRFSGIHLLQLIVFNQIFSMIAFSILSMLMAYSLNPITLLLLLLLSICFLGGARLCARELVYRARPAGQRVLIYGAGDAGTQLLVSLRQSKQYQVLGFVDDVNYSKKTKIHGIEIYPAFRLSEIIAKKNIGTVILAMPGATRQRLAHIINELASLHLNVKTMPKISDLLAGKSGLSDLEEVRIEELLGRAPVVPNEELLSSNITGKVVLVTGAGGSIGSELCRQIIDGTPMRLILIEPSELALYAIQHDLESTWGHLISPLLVTVADKESMERIMINECVDSVYHAAAYKHVPLVESNPFAAIINNVVGTKNTLEAALKANVSSFTLISTDKAVRPTNIMGASKRLAEILCQLSSQKADCKTRISLVRFGNVLGSSGSVIPKFRDQIKSGGPVTVTHPDITRYFMVIPEAVQLVLQASSMARAGEVFVLDMGAPVKIVDLAEKLIRLSGNSPYYREFSEHGGIRIEFTGLRPGEKLFEELLISGKAETTVHPQIRKIKESHPSQTEFDRLLGDLAIICSNSDLLGLRRILHNDHIGYGPAGENPESLLGGVSGERGFPGSTEIQESSVAPFNVTPEANNKEKIYSDQNKRIASSLSRGGASSPKALAIRLFLRVLHFYFLISRPVTLGVRCVMLNSKKEVLLVKHTYIAGWHLPGGGVDPGESVQRALSREINEETGFSIVDSPKLIGVFHCEEITKRDHVSLFLSENFETAGTKNNSLEIKYVQLFSVDNLPSDIDENSKEWLLAALNSRKSLFKTIRDR